jgi:type 1 fimbria pilin
VNREWRARVHATTTGRTMLRNGLVAYTLLQDSGNDPSRYAAGFTGTTNAAGSAIALNDSTTDFASRLAADLGKEVRNLTDGSKAVITALADGSLSTTPLTGGADNQWQLGDTYEIADGINAVRLRDEPTG